MGNQSVSHPPDVATSGVVWWPHCVQLKDYQPEKDHCHNWFRVGPPLWGVVGDGRYYKRLHEIQTNMWHYRDAIPGDSGTEAVQTRTRQRGQRRVGRAMSGEIDGGDSGCLPPSAPPVSAVSTPGPSWHPRATPGPHPLLPHFCAGAQPCGINVAKPGRLSSLALLPDNQCLRSHNSPIPINYVFPWPIKLFSTSNLI